MNGLPTILMHFPQRCYRDCKRHGTLPVPPYLRSAFPDLPGYARCGALMPRVLGPLYV